MREELAARIAPQSDMEVCGEAASRDEAFAQVKATSPDSVIVDMSLADSNGIGLIKDIKAQNS